MTLQSNARGFFSDVATLEPGRYVIMARLPGKVEGCAVDDVIGGEVVRLRIQIGHDAIMCTGPRVHPALVDPNATADGLSYLDRTRRAGPGRYARTLRAGRGRWHARGRDPARARSRS